MQGNNTLILNEATIQRALQYWLDHQVFRGDVSGIKVTGVEGVYQDGVTGFKIGLTDEGVIKPGTVISRDVDSVPQDVRDGTQL
jgi:hypothetical protein